MFSLNAGASCIELLRFQVNERLGLSDNKLFSPQIKKHLKRKKKQIKYNVSILGSFDTVVNLKSYQNLKLLSELIESNIIGDKMSSNLKILFRVINEPHIFKFWAFDLYLDLVTQTYLTGDSRLIESFEINQKFDEEIFLRVILERLSIAGFSSDRFKVKELDKKYENDKFAKLLISNQIFIDRYFDNSGHGTFTHILQLDFAAYGINNIDKDPQVVSEVYQWFGQNKIYKVKSGDYNSLEDGWGSFFDSLENQDLTSPEVFTLMTFDIFNL